MSPAEDPDYTPPTAASSAGTPFRSRRKCAKAAGAFIAAAVKEEMSVPPAPTSANKRSYARANSHSSIASTSSTTTNTASSSTGSLHAHAAKDSKGRPKKKTALSSYAVEYLKAWMMSPDHIEHPYPTEDEKLKIMKETNIELKQLTNWFVNNRKRYWKPKVEEMRRQSGNLNVTLQEMAARSQVASTVAQIAAINSGADGAPRKNSIASAVSSSEGEESHTSFLENMIKKDPSPKKRKKYSTLMNTSTNSNTTMEEGGRKSLTTTAAMGSVPRRSSKKAKEMTPSQQQQSDPSSEVGVANPMDILPGIHTASTHASVKASRTRKMSHDLSTTKSSSSDLNATVNATATATPNATAIATGTTRKMSRVISEPSSSETELSDCEMMSPSSSPIMEPVAAVSNPLANVVSMSSSSAIDSIVNDPIINIRSASSGSMAAITTAIATTSTPVPAGRAAPATAAANIAADLDYSISPLDSAVLANTINPGTAATTAAAVAQANAAANAGFCCSIMPHSCNDPFNKDRLVPPCALCSACRDWNLGEFCPWDLTGIIGDLSTDAELTDLTIKKEEKEEAVPLTDLATVTSAGSTSDTESSAHGREEATTITKSSHIDYMADMLSIDGDMDHIPDFASLGGDMEPTSDLEPTTITSSMTTVPQEISHSKSATDFMVDIQTWS